MTLSLTIKCDECGAFRPCGALPVLVDDMDAAIDQLAPPGWEIRGEDEDAKDVCVLCIAREDAKG